MIRTAVASVDSTAVVMVVGTAVSKVENWAGSMAVLLVLQSVDSTAVVMVVGTAVWTAVNLAVLRAGLSVP